MTPEASLLTPEVLALIGTANEPVEVTVTPGSVRRSLITILGRNPGLHFEPGDEVPGYVLYALQPEGDEMPMPDLMPGKIEVSNELVFVRPIRLGERLTVRGSLGNITERFGGRFGYSLLVRMDTEFLDESGEMVARIMLTGMQYDPRGAVDTGAE